jgi:integrase
MLLCLLDSGCRRAEFLALNLGDVDMQPGAVTVHRGNQTSRAALLGDKNAKAPLACLPSRRAAVGLRQARPTTVNLLVGALTITYGPGAVPQGPAANGLAVSRRRQYAKLAGATCWPTVL